MILFKLLQNIYGTASSILNGRHEKKLAELQTHEMLANYQKYHDILYYSKPLLQKLRQERLRKLLIYAKSNSPWYQKSLAHIDVDNFTEEKLNEIPPLNKTILMENWDNIVTDKRLSLELVEKHIATKRYNNNKLYFLNNYHVLSTSGSSGTRGIYIYNREEWNEYYLYAIRSPLYNKDRSKILINPQRNFKLAQVVIKNTVYAMYALAKTYSFPNVENFYVPVTLPLDKIIKKLNQIQPNILQGIPSTIHKLCLEAEKGNLNIHPEIISVGAEPLYQPTREFIKKMWPAANLFNSFGSSEGLYGICCHGDSEEMHLNDDACIVEPVDELNNPVALGVSSKKLYVTNLYNYTLPLIRYEMNDQLTFLNKKCDCGREHQLIAAPKGRPEFDFIYPGNIFVHHLVFVTPLLLEKNVLEYQVIQTKRGADIKLLLTGFVDKQQLRHSISTKLNKIGLHNPQINLLEVKSIDYPESGKLRRFIKLPSI